MLSSGAPPHELFITIGANPFSYPLFPHPEKPGLQGVGRWGADDADTGLSPPLMSPSLLGQAPPDLVSAPLSPGPACLLPARSPLWLLPSLTATGALSPAVREPLTTSGSERDRDQSAHPSQPGRDPRKPGGTLNSQPRPDLRPPSDGHCQDVPPQVWPPRARALRRGRGGRT